jgi:two-component system OmpR family sensor kinase
VTDDGPGIPAELQPTLFERFVRGDASRSRAAGSTGLGLAIVQAVVAAHHGQVTVDSRPGRTRFAITLPALPPEPTTAEPMNGEPVNAEPMNAEPEPPTGASPDAGPPAAGPAR